MKRVNNRYLKFLCERPDMGSNIDQRVSVQHVRLNPIQKLFNISRNARINIEPDFVEKPDRRRVVRDILYPKQVSALQPRIRDSFAKLHRHFAPGKRTRPDLIARCGLALG